MDGTIVTVFANLSDATNTTGRPKTKVNEFDWPDIIILIALCLILVIGVLGNCLVCVLFRGNRKKKQLATMERLIFQLAIVDLIASIINPSLYIYWQVTFNQKWHFGLIGCKILPTLAKATVSISLGIILIITVDRCIIITRPFHPHPKRIHLNIALGVVVVLSFMKELPNIIYLEVVPGVTCVVPDASNPRFVYPLITMNILRDVTFLSLFILTSLLIYCELYNKEHLAALRAHKDIKKTKEVVVMLVTMAVVFVLLVFPRDILHTSYAISWLSPPGIAYTKTLRDINAILKILHMCNSVCNVFIYAGLHGRFRKELIRLMKRFFCTVVDRRTITVYSDTSFSFDDDDNQYGMYNRKNINYVIPLTQCQEENHNTLPAIRSITVVTNIDFTYTTAHMNEEEFHRLTETDM